VEGGRAGADYDRFPSKKVLQGLLKLGCPGASSPIAFFQGLEEVVFFCLALGGAMEREHAY